MSVQADRINVRGLVLHGWWEQSSGLIGKSLFRGSRMLLQPGNVVVTRGRGGVWRTGRSPKVQRRGRAYITPFVDFGMAVRKREAAGSIVIGTRKIGGKLVSCRGVGGIPVRVGHEIAPIDAILAHVHEDKAAGWADRRGADLPVSAENSVISRPWPPADVTAALLGKAAAVKIHRHRAHARFGSAADHKK
jgi:hypothetical protein